MYCLWKVPTTLLHACLYCHHITKASFFLCYYYNYLLCKRKNVEFVPKTIQYNDNYSCNRWFEVPRSLTLREFIADWLVDSDSIRATKPSITSPRSVVVSAAYEVGIQEVQKQMCILYISVHHSLSLSCQFSEWACICRSPHV